MTDWYYAQGNVQRGPVTQNFLVNAMRSGNVTANDLVWHEGMAEWTPAGRVRQLIAAPGVAPAQLARMYAAPAVPPAGAPMQYASPNYQQPAPYATYAMVAMILGLVSLAVGGPLVAIPGMIFGHIALRGMRRTGNFQNKGFAIVGIVIGWIEVGLIAALILIMVIVVAGGALAASSAPSIIKRSCTLPQTAAGDCGGGACWRRRSRGCRGNSISTARRGRTRHPAWHCQTRTSARHPAPGPGRRG
jgi:GYF domain 2/Domain of unknown function (DUF4190)